MVLLVLILIPLTTILMPRRYFKRYSIATAALFVILLVLLGLTQENGNDDDGAEIYGFFMVAVLILFNAIILGIKYIALRKTKPKAM